MNIRFNFKSEIQIESVFEIFKPFLGFSPIFETMKKNVKIAIEYCQIIFKIMIFEGVWCELPLIVATQPEGNFILIHISMRLNKYIENFIINRLEITVYSRVTFEI